MLFPNLKPLHTHEKTLAVEDDETNLLIDTGIPSVSAIPHSEGILN